jgi:glycosyltransferase involved in cell wall biosynthesis
VISKSKILFLQKDVSRYNIPLYNFLNRHHDITVAYTNNVFDVNSIQFSVIKLNSYSFFGLVICKSVLKICSKYDIVIFMGDLHFISYVMLPFLNRNFKTIIWTIGIRASYTLKYDVSRNKSFLDYVYLFLIKNSNASIFYSNKAILFWGKLLNKQNVFIANNTVEVNTTKQTVLSKTRNNILFIGTLYKEKGIFELLNVFKKLLFDNCEEFFFLDVVGDGPEMSAIQKFIDDHNMSMNIKLHGAVYDSNEIAKFFSNAMLCISPTQAGLSVLTSLGHGVPFVTRNDAITGGEINNIVHGHNGYLYKSSEELYDIILESKKNPGLMYKMSLQCFEYYISHCTIEHMGKGFLDAIDYVKNKYNG